MKDPWVNGKVPLELFLFVGLAWPVGCLAVPKCFETLEV